MFQLPSSSRVEKSRSTTLKGLVKEAYDGIFLGGAKIPTENDRDIANCLIKVADFYGVPDETLHDLSLSLIHI